MNLRFYVVAIFSMIIFFGIGNIYAAENESVRLLSDFGSVSTMEQAKNSFDNAKKKMQHTGGVIILTSNVCPEFRVDYIKQDRINSPSLTVVDLRNGRIKAALPELGYRDPLAPVGYPSIDLDRTINCESTNINGSNTMVRLENTFIHGGSSYFQPVSEDQPTDNPDVRRVYLRTVKGLSLGLHLQVMMGEGKRGKSGEFEASSVEAKVIAIGWDKNKLAHYVDLKREGLTDANGQSVAGKKPWQKVLRLFNKSSASALQINDTIHCDAENPGSILIEKNIFGQGDNFGIQMGYYHMGNIGSAMGDEYGLGYNVDLWHLLDSFEGKVDSWNPETHCLKYSMDSRRANTLGTSRPIINLNHSKWITTGQAMVVLQNTSSWEVDRKGYIRGINTNWSDELVGRFFAFDSPDEHCGTAPGSFWSYALKRRKEPVRRWWHIRKYAKDKQGNDCLWVERHVGIVREFASPTLLNPDNNRKALPYIIAPGAMVCDVRDGILEVHKTMRKGTSIMPGANDKRKIILAPSSSDGGKIDFAAGDPVEQAVGSDPANPSGYRVRHRESMPTNNKNASFFSVNNGSYPVYAALLVAAHGDRTMHLPQMNKFKQGVSLEASMDIGLAISGKTGKAAIFLDSTTSKSEQAIEWKTSSKKNSARLSADMTSGNITISGTDLSLQGNSLCNAGGVSSTKISAKNLRGINQTVASGQKEIIIKFQIPESDAAYAVSVQPSWLTNDAVCQKTTSGFSVKFDSPAPQNATIDWILIR